MFDDLQTVVLNGFKTGILREQPLTFLGEVIQALADSVLQMAARDPAGLDAYKALGWTALWGGNRPPLTRTFFMAKWLADFKNVRETASSW